MMPPVFAFPTRMAEIATQPPTQFTTGTTVVFTRLEDPDRASADGWALKWALAGAATVTVTATAAAGVWTCTLTATANVLPAGSYRWTLTEEKATPALERYVVASGVLQVDANPLAATGANQQLTDEAELALLDAAIAARLRGDVAEYSIGDRSLKKLELKDLISWRNTVRSRIARRLRGGRFQQIQVGFGGPWNA